MAASIAFRLSGGAANNDPAASLGGAMSSVGVTADTLFDTTSASEAFAGDTEYRCIYAYNDGTEDFTLANVYIALQATVGVLALALGGEGLNGTAETVADEDTAPVGETFSSPTTGAGGLAMGALAQGDQYPIWVRRTISAATGGTSLASNPAQLGVYAEYVPA